MRAAPGEPVVRAQRLSQWLAARASRPQDYLPGTVWGVPDEIPRQRALQLELQADLMGLARTPTDRSSVSQRQRSAEAPRRQAAANLLGWMAALPVTGRVPLRSADVRWLEVNAAHDPVLAEGHRVWVPPRPSTVTVITPDGLRCQVPHRAQAEALAYVAACNGAQAASQVDHAWVAQPDGRVMRHGVARWNERSQSPPAPGAWIWAPPRDQRWPDATSARIIALLATQGPAADEGAPALRPATRRARRLARHPAQRAALHRASAPARHPPWHSPRPRGTCP